MSSSLKTNALLWSKLKTAVHAERLGHALLLGFSPQGTSEKDFYRALYRFCEYLQCDQKKGPEQSCGHCDSCAAYAHYKGLDELLHPDLYLMSPENEGSAYSVDQIRELSVQFSLRRALSPQRVAILRDAEFLSWSHTAPANALLKLLEEPRPHSLLILTSSRPQGILKTLLSRCQSFRFLPENHDADGKELAEWNSFFQWVSSGMPTQDAAANPADRETFWKERSEAFDELSKVFVTSFDIFKKNVSRLSLAESRRSLDFLNAWQEFLQQSRFHIQGHLHWLEIQKSLRKAG